MKKISLLIFSIFAFSFLRAEDGHELWLRKKNAVPVNVVSAKKSSTLTIAMQELQQGWQGKSGVSIVLTVKKDNAIKGDGFKLTQSGVQANTDLGVLYGVYELLCRQQTGQNLQDVVISNPSYQHRILNH